MITHVLRCLKLLVIGFFNCNIQPFGGELLPSPVKWVHLQTSRISCVHGQYTDWTLYHIVNAHHRVLQSLIVLSNFYRHFLLLTYLCRRCFQAGVIFARRVPNGCSQGIRMKLQCNRMVVTALCFFMRNVVMELYDSVFVTQQNSLLSSTLMEIYSWELKNTMCLKLAYVHCILLLFFFFFSDSFSYKQNQQLLDISVCIATTEEFFCKQNLTEFLKMILIFVNQSKKYEEKVFFISIGRGVGETLVGVKTFCYFNCLYMYVIFLYYDRPSFSCDNLDFPE